MTTSLARINWSFATPFTVGRSGTRLFDARKHHWYPATFIPEIPFTLIELLSRPGETVLDPFAGIGTTILQAIALGRHAVGLENSQVAATIARRLTTLAVQPARLPEFDREVLPLIGRYDEERDYLPKLPVGRRAGFELLRPWFSANTLNEIAFLSVELDRNASRSLRLLGDVCVSALLKAVCAQDKGWGCIADNVLPDAGQVRQPRDAIGRFGRNARVLLRDLEVLRSEQTVGPPVGRDAPPLRATVSRVDMKVAASAATPVADLLVTSPPYLSMTDYVTSQRLSYYWFGLPMEEEFAVEIGARRRRNRLDATTRYVGDMHAALRNACARLKEGGHAAFVMPAFSGQRPSDRRRRDATREVMRGVEQIGFEPVQELARFLPARRRHHNQNWTSLSREVIHIFRKAR